MPESIRNQLIWRATLLPHKCSFSFKQPYLYEPFLDVNHPLVSLKTGDLLIYKLLLGQYSYVCDPFMQSVSI